MPTMQLNNDVALGVAIPSRNARGRIARLGSVVNSILAAHEYPPLLENLLAEFVRLPTDVPAAASGRAGEQSST